MLTLRYRAIDSAKLAIFLSAIDFLLNLAECQAQHFNHRNERLSLLRAQRDLAWPTQTVNDGYHKELDSEAGRFLQPADVFVVHPAKSVARAAPRGGRKSPPATAPINQQANHIEPAQTPLNYQPTIPPHHTYVTKPERPLDYQPNMPEQPPRESNGLSYATRVPEVIHNNFPERPPIPVGYIQQSNQQSTSSNQYPSQQSASSNQYPSQQSTSSNQYPSQQSTSSNQYPSQQSTSSNQYPSQQSTSSNQYPSQQSTSSNQYPSQQSTSSNQYPSQQSTSSNQYPSQQSTSSNQYPSQQSTSSNQYPSQQSTSSNQYPSQQSTSSNQYPSQQSTSSNQYPSQQSTSSNQYPSQQSTSSNQYPSQQSTSSNQYPSQQSTSSNQYPSQQSTSSNQYPSQQSTSSNQYPSQQSTSSNQYPSQQSTSSNQYPSQQSTSSNQYPSQQSTSSNQYPSQQSTSSNQYPSQQSTSSNQYPSQQSTSSNQYPSQQSTSSNQYPSQQSTSSNQYPSQQSTSSNQYPSQQSTSSHQYPSQQSNQQSTSSNQYPSKQSNQQSTSSNQYQSTAQTSDTLLIQQYAAQQNRPSSRPSAGTYIQQQPQPNNYQRPQPQLQVPNINQQSQQTTGSHNPSFQLLRNQQGNTQQAIGHHYPQRRPTYAGSGYPSPSQPQVARNQQGSYSRQPQTVPLNMQAVSYGQTITGRNYASASSQQGSNNVPASGNVWTAPVATYTGVARPTVGSGFLMPSCGRDEVLCGSLNLCVQLTQLCDKKYDCPDGSDERACGQQGSSPNAGYPATTNNNAATAAIQSYPSPTPTPTRTQYRRVVSQQCADRQKPCSDGIGCYYEFERCNQRYNCQDGSDETNCGHALHNEPATSSTSTPPPTTTRHPCPGLWPCRSGTQCIDLESVCDFVRHCKDASDEGPYANCDVRRLALRNTNTEPDTRPAQTFRGSSLYSRRHRILTHLG